MSSNGTHLPPQDHEVPPKARATARSVGPCIEESAISARDASTSASEGLKLPDSIKATESPRLAHSRASAIPTGPQPMMQMSSLEPDVRSVLKIMESRLQPFGVDSV